jgi:hypothetical protein
MVRAFGIVICGLKTFLPWQNVPPTATKPSAEWYVPFLRCE